MHQYKRWVIFTGAGFLLISAALVNVAHLYYMSALLLSLPVISYLVGMVALRDLEFGHETPGTGWEGEVVDFQIVVTSRSRIPRLFLQAYGHLSEWIHPVEEEPPFFNAPPSRTTKIPYRVELCKRGAYGIEDLTVTALDPLGIFSFSRRYRVDSEMLVYPTPQPISDFLISGAERFGFRDLPIAATRGSGVDPDGVREYIPGDPLRRMHWKSTARTGKLNVIEFEESRAINIVMALDLHQGINIGEGKETTLEYLIRAAASLAQSGIRQGASVRLVKGDEPDTADFAGRGTEHLFAILTSLARAEAIDPAPLGTRLVARVGALLPGTTLIVLTSGLDTELPGALAHYTASGIEALVFYADPRAFQPAARLPMRAAQRTLIEGLFTSKVTSFILRPQEQGQITPEPIDHVRDFAEN